MAREPFRFRVGDATTRQGLHDAYGIAPQGGIVASVGSQLVCVFIDHGEGKQFGYSDGFDAQGAVLHYTGAGQDGDQTLDKSNSSIMTHAEKGRTLHAFVADGIAPGTKQTKLQRYVGEFLLDPLMPYERRPAPDSRGRLRTVVVFRLLPVSSPVEQLLAKVGFTDITDGADSREVPVEITSDYFFETSGTTGTAAVRRESMLVDEFVASQQHEFGRWAINVPEERSPLLTDVYDREDRVLYEAKAASGRTDMRMAVGQLYDYRRHVPVDDLRCAILLPKRPKADLRDFVERAGLGLVFKENEAFNFELAGASEHGVRRSTTPGAMFSA